MRVKTGKVRRRSHNKVLKATKGYRMSRGRLYRVSHEAFMHAGQYSVNDRRHRAGQFRRVWIQRINAALQEHGIKYSEFISKLTKAGIALNRKVLAELAFSQPEAFSQVVERVK